MAFLIGTNLDNRKRIVQEVEDFYRIRSRLIHHGHEATQQDIQKIDKFFFDVWWTFRHLIASVDQYKTRADLISALDDRKLS